MLCVLSVSPRYLPSHRCPPHLSLVLWIKLIFTLPKDMVHFYSQQKAFERTLFWLCRRQQVSCSSESSHGRVESPVLLRPPLGSNREYCSLSLGHFKVAFYLSSFFLGVITPSFYHHFPNRWVEKWQRRYQSHRLLMYLHGQDQRAEPSYTECLQRIRKRFSSGLEYKVWYLI